MFKVSCTILNFINFIFNLKNDICCAHDIMEAKNTAKVARTVIMLVNFNQYAQQQHQVENQFDFRQNHNNLNQSVSLSLGQQQQQQTAV